MINTKYEAVLESVMSAVNTGELTEEQAFDVLDLAKDRYGSELVTEADASSRKDVGKIIAGAAAATGILALIYKRYSDKKNISENLKDETLKKTYEEMRDLEKKLNASRKEINDCIKDLNTAIDNYNDIAKNADAPTIPLSRNYYVPYQEYNQAVGVYETKFQNVTTKSDTPNPAYNPKLALQCKKALDDVKEALDDVSKAAAELNTTVIAFNRASIRFKQLLKKKNPLGEGNKRRDKNLAVLTYTRDTIDNAKHDYSSTVKSARERLSNANRKLSDESKTYNVNINQ